MESLRNCFVEKLIDLAGINKKIVALDCDMAKHNRLSIFAKKYPKRFMQVGISEQNAVGIAAGLSRGGKIPIVSSFAVFICGRAWEQIRHSVIYNNTNVKIFATHAGLAAGEDGASHQCLEDIALMMALPQIEVFSPAFPTECKKICDYIITSENPAYVRVGRDEVEFDIMEMPDIGNPIVFGNKDSDTIVISTGETSQEIFKMARENTEVKCMHIGSLRPMNVCSIQQELRGIKKVIIVEEHAKYGGLASILYINNLLKMKEVVLMNMNEKFGQTGNIEELREFYGVGIKAVMGEIKKI